MNTADLTACEIRDLIRLGKLSSREAVEGCFEAIERLDLRLNAFLSTSKDAALKRADDIDRKIAAGERVGALAGLPVAIKDNMCTSDGQATTCASRILENFHAPYD
ncbi:MAG: amidase family protein, partial [Planctomycetia bacterium]|nr:amidase family protein [Planctomycetia bacterium]